MKITSRKTVLPLGCVSNFKRVSKVLLEKGNPSCPDLGQLGAVLARAHWFIGVFVTLVRELTGFDTYQNGLKVTI